MYYKLWGEKTKEDKVTKANRVIDRAGLHVKADFVVAEGFFYIKFKKYIF